MINISDSIIAFDESGNTGADLLDLEQPIFVLCSVKLSYQQAEELKALIKSPATELKFNRLKKYHKYHEQILSLLSSDILSVDTVAISIFHKEYCICVHTADRLVEAVLYREGLDFYENGENLAYTNLLYSCTPVFCDDIIYKHYQKAFIQLFYIRDKNSIDSFYAIVNALIQSCKNEQYKIALFPIARSKEFIHEILEDWDTYNFDSTLSAFIQHIDYWGRKSVEKFDAFVDDSKPLVHFRDYLTVIQSIDINEEIGADRRTLQLPLKLNEIIFTNSRENVVVQIADLIAGSINYFFRTLASEESNRIYSDDLAKRIGESKIVRLVTNAVWPHLAVTPEDLGTVHDGRVNSLDSIANLIRKHK